jgi:hypothetical protein
MIRVEVASHFNEDAFSHGLARGFADRLRSGLPEYSCPTHGESPLVRLSTDGVAQTTNQIHVEITACCDPAAERTRRSVDALRQIGEEGSPT